LLKYKTLNILAIDIDWHLWRPCL